MSDLTIARTDMALSLGFHIVFAVFGMAMPLLMCVAEALWLKTRNQVYLDLARAWAKGTAVLFAVGAVSGTVLSFELGLLWPHFMEYAGPIIGMPFSLEGFAFFLEAIFLGIYLYGWGRVPDKAHWLAGVMVWLGGTASGIFIMAANAWMNSPAGFEVQDGTVVNVDPWKAMFNPAFFPQAVHMILAAFQAVGFAVAGMHAYFLLKDRSSLFHQKALAIAFPIGAVLALIQPLSGDLLARHVAEFQPAKLAAFEGQWETMRGAPLRVGGLPDEKTETTPYAIELPKLLSFLAYGDLNAEVRGLKSFAPEDRPPVAVVHVAFQLMLAFAFAMIGLALWGLFLLWRKKGLNCPGFLRALAAGTPLGILAIEAGWVVTEVGRQPWIIYGFQRTQDAVTPMPHLGFSFFLFLSIYLILSFAVVTTLRRYVFPGTKSKGEGS